MSAPQGRAVCGVALCAMLALPASVADAAPACVARLLPPAIPAPAAAQCRRGQPQADPATAAQAWLDAARADTGAGRFDAAARALDCAQVALGAHRDGPPLYQLIRRRGVLAYRREDIPQALQQFECALAMARDLDDATAIARELNNIGTALRRLGDLRGALQALTRSLDLQRRDGAVGGAVFNNIADVYRELDDPRQAMAFYRQALDAFRRVGNGVESAHVLESMSALDLDRGIDGHADAWLQQALHAYREHDHYAYQLRVYAGLIQVALLRHDVAQAGQWRANAFALAERQRLPVPASLHLQAVRSLRQAGQGNAARALAERALEIAPADAPERVGLWRELAQLQQAGGDMAGALASERRAHALERDWAKAQHDRQLGWLRARFETDRRDRTIAGLAAENTLRRAQLHQRTLLLGLTLALALVAGLAVALVWLRRRQRARVLEAQRQVHQEAALASYRRETEILNADRARLQALLDTREDAVCLLDADGQVLAANRAARALLQVSADAMGAVGEHVLPADRESLTAALERSDDLPSQHIELRTLASGRPLQAQLTAWSGGEGLIVLTLREGDLATDPVPELDAGSTAAKGALEEELRDGFRRALVELMLAVVEAWERASGQNPLELAERSRIWRVTIDGGRLRARAMERYLALAKLPRQPRWRDVLRTAYFVQGHCALRGDDQARVQQRVEAVLAYTRRRALV
ncbi:tetratricopeptide repeat protein [Lysobacter yangpyeongensis]|uniref:Tetratricopeptide repeat protein n=1 Tax=Lysobacter yangpyeongensis TaxID=346182 RepID=A0ABW0SMJ5_9GAMM